MIQNQLKNPHRLFKDLATWETFFSFYRKALVFDEIIMSNSKNAKCF